MTKEKNGSDLQGVGRLTIDAVKGVTDLVEALHHTIVSLGGLLGEPGQQRTRGITGMIYHNIRIITHFTGVGVDVLLEKLALVIEGEEASPKREALQAVVNGVLGDHLAKKENPLGIPMQFRVNGKPVKVDDPALSKSLDLSNGKILLMVHGSCMNDLQWCRKGHDHGTALARDFGYLPVYLRYNSGRHISHNGRDFADLIETFAKQMPRDVELTILAHSMGGLVTRSAYHYGKLSQHAWLQHLRKLVFLGTPHHGAPLEVGGNWIDNLLEISPYSAPFSRLGKIRSAGITDMRYGNITDEDWQGRDRFRHAGDQRVPVPLPEDVRCYVMGATMGKESSMIGDDLVGDGLVPIDSAMGRHKNPERTLFFSKSRQWIGRNMSHFDLLNHPDAYEVIKKWLGT